ncbi:hypothetical protein N9L38_04535 [Candidatus Poseidoniales archaeon]|nr:hypothetical protein [Candidatus Poseidoniales archaeon]
MDEAGGGFMSSEENTEEKGFLDLISNPSMGLSKWYIAIGAWGLVLALLNFIGEIHPTYRVSWGGLLTFELLADAFGDKDTAAAFVVGDAVFMIGCGVLVALGLKSINESNEGGVASFLQSMVINDTWPALVGGEGGMMRAIGAWCLLLGFGFYIAFSVMNQTWIDLGVYSVSVTLVAFGFALNSASRAPPGDDTVM